ncbi:antirestriction Ral family protein [Escherichia coli]
MNRRAVITLCYLAKPEEMFPVIEDWKYVDKWAIRTTAMVARELGKQNNKAA